MLNITQVNGIIFPTTENQLFLINLAAFQWTSFTHSFYYHFKVTDKVAE